MSTMSNGRVEHAAEFDARSLDERTLCDEDGGAAHGRPSSELSEGDHDILESEDERERLLTKEKGISSVFGRTAVRVGPRDNMNTRAGKQRQREAGRGGEASALLYELEGGPGVSDASLSRRSSDSDEQRLLASKSQRKVGYQIALALHAT